LTTAGETPALRVPSVLFLLCGKSQTIIGLHASGSSSIRSNHTARGDSALLRSRTVFARAHRVRHFGFNWGSRSSHHVAGGRSRALPWISARYAAHLPDSRAVDHRSYRRVRWILFTGLFFHFRRFPERDHTSCDLCVGGAFVLVGAGARVLLSACSAFLDAARGACSHSRGHVSAYLFLLCLRCGWTR